MKGDILIKKAKLLIQQKNPNYKEAAQLLERASQFNNPEAIYALGTWYFHGKYFKRDRVKGFRLMLQAADLFHPNACYDVAASFELGSGIEKNLKKAFIYYMRAMILGDRQSIYEVGRCYYYGYGTNVNKDIAKEIITIAIDVYEVS